MKIKSFMQQLNEIGFRDKGHTIKIKMPMVLGRDKDQHNDLDEEVAANNIGSGGIAGTDGVVRRDTFAGCKVFDVDSDTFNKCRNGKKKWARWKNYINIESDAGRAIYTYGLNNPKKNIVLRNESDGSMLYLRRR